MKRIKNRKFVPLILLCAAIILQTCDASGTTLGRRPKKRKDFSKLISDEGLCSYTDIRRQFTVYAPTDQLAVEINEAAVSVRKSLYKFLNCTRSWDSPAIIKIFPAKAEMPWKGPEAAATQLSYRGKKVRLIISYDAPDLKKHYLKHEIVHLLVADLANESFFRGKGAERKVPRWVNEGLAEYITAPKEKREEYRELVYAAETMGAAFPFTMIISRKRYPEAIHLFYAQSFSLVSFLANIPDGPVKLRNYITSSSADAKDPKKRLLLTFHSDFPTIKTINDSWREYIEKNYAKPETEWSARTFLGLGSIYLTAKHYDQAIALAKEALNKDPKVKEARTVLGFAYYKKGDMSAAMHQLDAGFREDPDSAYLCLIRGLVYRKLGMKQESLSAFVRATELDGRLGPIIIEDNGQKRIDETKLAILLKRIGESYE